MIFSEGSGEGHIERQIIDLVSRRISQREHHIFQSFIKSGEIISRTCQDATDVNNLQKELDFRNIPACKLPIEVSDLVEIDDEPPRLRVEHSGDSIAMIRLVGACDRGYRMIEILLEHAHPIEEDSI